MKQNNIPVTQEASAAAQRNYKDTLFRMIFKEKKQLLKLYNAVNGTHYEDPEELEIVTLENAVYMNVKNDLAFILDFQLYLYEHQSTVNPNMPLRDSLYMLCELQKLVDKKSLYSSTQIKIPTPRFVVFYNGLDEQPERSIQRLSDAFITPVEDPDLEAKVLVLNINYGHNAEIMEGCKTLQDYSIYVQKVRDYAEQMPLNEAVERAVNECIKEGVLEEFLLKCRAEAIQVSIFEYDEGREMRLIRQGEREAGKEEGIRIGKEAGHREGIAQGVEQGIEQGIKQGIAQGIKQGIAQGIEQGIAQGIKQGEQEKLRVLVRNMIERGYPDEDICAVAECEQELVNEVRRSI